MPGGVDDSYGIDVAKLAGLPNKVLTRARALLAELEEKAETPTVAPQADAQISFASVQREALADKLRKTNPAELSDAECRHLLEDLAAMANA